MENYKSYVLEEGRDIEMNDETQDDYIFIYESEIEDEGIYKMILEGDPREVFIFDTLEVVSSSYWLREEGN